MMHACHKTYRNAALRVQAVHSGRSKDKCTGKLHRKPQAPRTHVLAVRQIQRCRVRWHSQQWAHATDTHSITSYPVQATRQDRSNDECGVRVKAASNATNTAISRACSVSDTAAQRAVALATVHMRHLEVSRTALHLPADTSQYGAHAARQRPGRGSTRSSPTTCSGRFLFKTAMHKIRQFPGVSHIFDHLGSHSPPRPRPLRPRPAHAQALFGTPRHLRSLS